MPPLPGELRVLHITPRLTRAAGGAWHYVEGLTRALEQIGVRSAVAGVVDHGSSDFESLAASQVLVGPPSVLPANYGFSSPLRRRLMSELARVDLVHAHGFRVGTDLLAMRIARRDHAPLLLSPHGQLHPAIAGRGGVKKAVVNALWAKRFLRSIDAALAVGETEAAVIQAAVPDKQVYTLPIGIDVGAYGRVSDAAALATLAPATRRKRVVLYLAHMHTNKGLGRLAEAWLTLYRDHPGWHLVFAGVDVGGHGAATAERLRAAGAGNSFTLIGPIFDQTKRDVMASANVFTMPSDAESFGIAFAESLASGVPVIATCGAPWASVVETKSGWWVEPTVDAVALALREAMALSDDERRAMGERGRTMVVDRFDWGTIACEMRRVYSDLIERHRHG